MKMKFDRVQQYPFSRWDYIASAMARHRDEVNTATVNIGLCISQIPAFIIDTEWLEFFCCIETVCWSSNPSS
jgi:hypothetical protein